MAPWLPPALCVEAIGWALVFALLSDRWRDDPERSAICARIAASCLVAGAGFLILWWGTKPAAAHGERAARTPRAALPHIHAPYSFPAAARDLALHCRNPLPNQPCCDDPSKHGVVSGCSTSRGRVV